LRHVLAEPHADLACGVGLLDETVLAAELGGLETFADLPVEYYLCGPEPMMAAARALLTRSGVPAQRIFEERFATLRYSDDKKSTTPQQMELRHAGQAPRQLTVLAGETLLDAGLRAGAALPFSCAMGGCGACKGRLVSGEVVMPEPNCLTAAERQGGHILCCVAQPLSAVSVEVS
jgi:ring-1,2-phenylacetyl-CoA epoxidase subunit PaaE